MTKYGDLDAEILKRITLRPAAFKDLELDRKVHEMAAALASKTGEAFRVLDRRLQALRKAGKIYFDGGYWKAKRQ